MEKGIIAGIKELPGKAKAKLQQGWNWTKENTDVLGGVVVPVIGAVVGVGGLIVQADSNRTALAEMGWNYCAYRDPVTNVVFRLNRPMAPKESAAVADAVRNGKPAEEILTYLGLI